MMNRKINIKLYHSKDFSKVKKKNKLISNKVSIRKIFSIKTLNFKLMKTLIRLARNKIINLEIKMQATYSLIEIFKIHYIKIFRIKMR